MDQICDTRMWGEHFHRPAEGICLENIEQWQGENFVLFIIIFKTLNCNLKTSIMTYYGE